MKVNIDPLKPEDKQALENMGIVVDEKGARFVKKELPPPEGFIRLSSKKLVRHEPIQECLAKW